MQAVTIVGGGLAGSEASWQLACRGIPVTLIEMRPDVSTGAHRSGDLAEIVCSNSLKSTRLDTGSGLLKAELELLGCRLLEIARDHRVPAGHALAVDRETFSAHVTELLSSHPLITVKRECQRTLDLALPAVVATGPLTERTLLEALGAHFSKRFLFFYDAIAPSIDAASVDHSLCFWASRYGKGDPDYLNVPLSEAEYMRLLCEIKAAELTRQHPFEKEHYFESCLPVEVMAARGADTLRFGPLRPKGLIDPRTGREPYAVIQLRQENREGSLLGLVGFQTRMTHACQKRVITCIPALAHSVILRYGAIHKNAYFNTPAVCLPYQRDAAREGLYYAGQICGVEGYVECIASGLVAAIGVAAYLTGHCLPHFPENTMVGALMAYLHTSTRNFQPMNANMGLLPARAAKRMPRRQRNEMLSRAALDALRGYCGRIPWFFEQT